MRSEVQTHAVLLDCMLLVGGSDGGAFAEDRAGQAVFLAVPVRMLLCRLTATVYRFHKNCLEEIAVNNKLSKLWIFKDTPGMKMQHPSISSCYKVVKDFSEK